MELWWKILVVTLVASSVSTGAASSSQQQQQNKTTTTTREGRYLRRRGHQDHHHQQPDDVADVDDYEELHGTCTRRCLQGDSRTCYYRFVLEFYHTMGAACGACPSNSTHCYNPQCVTADGLERGIVTINRRLPGPSIQVCEGDRVVVDLVNMASGRSASLHWHGILQMRSPHMDGIPGLTQCPVFEGATFRYDFLADTPGTHFWHSHDGLQKLDGVVGSLVVRQAEEDDPSAHLYHHDLPSHVVLVSDWLHSSAEERFPGLRKVNTGQNPDSFLVNGKGWRLASGPRASLASLLPPLEPSSPLIPRQLEDDGAGDVEEEGRANRYLRRPGRETPLAAFRVRRGRRYRLRLVAATCLVCPVRVSVQRHVLTVIATDGASVEPVTVGAVVMLPGERYDVILSADQEEDAYWIHVQGLAPCTLEGTHQLAVLWYHGSRRGEPSGRRPGYRGGFFPKGPEMNPLRAACDRGYCVNQLVASSPHQAEMAASLHHKHHHHHHHSAASKPDLSLTLHFGFHFFSAKELFKEGRYHRFFQPPLPVLVSGVINNVSYVPPSSPLLSQWSQAGLPRTGTCCGRFSGLGDYKECTHVVKLPLDAVVDILLVDQTSSLVSLTHPFHLHGFRFMVLEMGNAGSTVVRAPSRRPILKDTVAVPPGGFVKIRVFTDNPGFWLLHCHFLYHQLSGMELAFQVGELEEIPEAPQGFPTCGDFVPPV